MQFNWTVDLGHVITAVSLALVIWRARSTSQSRISQMDQRIDIMWRWFERQQIGSHDKGDPHA